MEFENKKILYIGKVFQFLLFEGPEAAGQMQMFLKNLAMIGGALMIILLLSKLMPQLKKRFLRKLNRPIWRPYQARKAPNS